MTCDIHRLNIYFFYFAFLARCAGLKNTQSKQGSCESLDPCTPNPCREGERYHSQRRVLIVKNSKVFQKFELVLLLVDRNTISICFSIDSNGSFFVFFRCVVERKVCLSVDEPCNQYHCGK